MLQFDLRTITRGDRWPTVNLVVRFKHQGLKSLAMKYLLMYMGWFASIALKNNFATETKYFYLSDDKMWHFMNSAQIYIVTSIYRCLRREQLGYRSCSFSETECESIMYTAKKLEISWTFIAHIKCRKKNTKI